MRKTNSIGKDIYYLFVINIIRILLPVTYKCNNNKGVDYVYSYATEVSFPF